MFIYIDFEILGLIIKIIELTYFVLSIIDLLRKLKMAKEKDVSPSKRKRPSARNSISKKK